MRGLFVTGGRYPRLVSGPPPIRVARFDELNPQELYAILRLRSDVFIVEQQCAYDDIDGLDALPTTTHVWIGDGDCAIGALRILSPEGRVPHIGRVVTAAPYRRQGIAERMMRAAINITGLPVEIKAQSRLAGWYSKLGFVPFGEEFDEYGILHQPMRLDRR